MAATRPYTSHPTNSSAVLFYRQCVSVNSNTFSYRTDVSEPYMSFDLHIVHVNLNIVICST
jgi:hypothetical protein